MCRRCGEPDGRGPAWQRRQRKQWLLSPESLWGGDGEKVQCWNYDDCGTYLTFESMEVDRIVPGFQCVTCANALQVVVHRDHDDEALGHPFKGGTYRQNNVRPSCGGCNRGRNKGNPWGHRTEPSEIRCMTR